MSDLIWIGIQGTVALWLVSASLAMLIALVLTAGVVSRNRAARYTARGIIDLTRGVPTSLIVITAGIATFRIPAPVELPTIYPGTPPSLQLLAWTIVLALAIGSAGHLAEIFRCARAAMGQGRLEAADVLGLPSLRRSALVAREVAALAVAPTGSRLVHHLHNTAFAALFPVTDLFGALQSETSVTFRVRDYAILGCVLYAGMSLAVWGLFRILESVFFRHARVTSRDLPPRAWSPLGQMVGADARPASPDVDSRRPIEGARR